MMMSRIRLTLLLVILGIAPDQAMGQETERALDLCGLHLAVAEFHVVPRVDAGSSAIPIQVTAPTGSHVLVAILKGSAREQVVLMTSPSDVRGSFALNIVGGRALGFAQGRDSLQWSAGGQTTVSRTLRSGPFTMAIAFVVPEFVQTLELATWSRVPRQQPVVPLKPPPAP